MRMWVYILRRLILLVPVIIGVMTITFVLVSSLPVHERLSSQFGAAPPRDAWLYQPLRPCPTNPAQECRNPVYYEDLAKLGLNKPIPVQWAVYIYNSFTLNWGTVGNGSTAGQTFQATQGQQVSTVLGWFLPYTLELAALSLAIILIIAIPLGNLAAVNRNRPVDQSARILSFSGYALPGFLLSSLALMAAVIAFGAGTGFFAHPPWCGPGETTWQEFTGSWPTYTCYNISAAAGNQGYPSWLTDGFISHPTGFPTVDALIHGQGWLALDTILRIAIPAMVIAFASIAGLLRFVRNSMLEVMNLDFVRTARAEGIPEQTVVKRHAGRNSLNVTITVLGLTFAAFIGGFPIIEDVFKLNGVGLILAYSVQISKGGIDFGLVFGATLLFTIIVVLANIIVDVLYAYLDPRVRLG
ncbi:MAG: ABC transporter permease [Thermoplasmata archaeon]|jgi:peptide/nickel transport system permease protein|nr:ABC transporter permease [Thermoplasmata archaeon]